MIKNYYKIVNDNIESLLENFKTTEDIMNLIRCECHPYRIEEYDGTEILRVKHGFVPYRKDPSLWPPREAVYISNYLDFVSVYEELFKPEYKTILKFCLTRAKKTMRDFRITRKFPDIHNKFRLNDSKFMFFLRNWYDRILDRHGFEVIITDKDLDSHLLKYRQLKEYLSVREYDIIERYRLEKEFFLKFSFEKVSDEAKIKLRDSFNRVDKELLEEFIPKEMDAIEKRLLNLKIMFNDII